MPPEVLGEIFSLTLPSVGDTLARRRFRNSHSPWVLTHVCSRWRAIALSIPSLWSLVVVNSLHKRASPMAMIKTQIERARSLKIHFHGTEERNSRPQVEMFRFLAEHSSRWEELFLELTCALCPLLSALHGCVPSLRRLDIVWEGSESQAVGLSIVSKQLPPSLKSRSATNIASYRSPSLPISSPGTSSTGLGRRITAS
ncbi:hypothetical protein FB451DRAFT_1234815 [Mycena latifolia]|nr:hypothetical protein FB451DRAFT_1234815 [Mycena latifolia]